MCFEVESSQVQVDTSIGLDAALSSAIAYFFGLFDPHFNFFTRVSDIGSALCSVYSFRMDVRSAFHFD